MKHRYWWESEYTPYNSEWQPSGWILQLQKSCSCNEWPYWLVNALLVNEYNCIPFAWEKKQRERQWVSYTQKTWDIQEYLSQTMPSQFEDTNNTYELKQLLQRQQFPMREKSLWEYFSEHYAINNRLEFNEIKERVVALDIFHKVIYSTFIGSFNRHLTSSLFGVWKKYMDKELKRTLSLHQLIEYEKNQEIHPYSLSLYRNKESMEKIKEYLWEKAFQNIATRYTTALANHTTISDQKHIQDKEWFYHIIKILYGNNIFNYIRIELTELLARELIEYIITTNQKKILKEISNIRTTVNSIRIFKTNKYVDIKNKTDFIISLEYENIEWERLFTSLPLDLKIHTWSWYKIVERTSSEKNNKVYKQKLYTDLWTYWLMQSKIMKRIHHTLLTGINHIKEQKNSKSKTPYKEWINMHIINTLDRLWWIIEELNSTISYYIESREIDEMMLFNNNLLEHLEDQLLQDDIEEDEWWVNTQYIIEHLEAFYQQLETYYWKYTVNVNLSTRKNNVPTKELHIWKRTMWRFFDIAFDSIKKYGTINYQCPILQKQMKWLEDNSLECYTQELINILSTQRA